MLTAPFRADSIRPGFHRYRYELLSFSLFRPLYADEVLSGHSGIKKGCSRHEQCCRYHSRCESGHFVSDISSPLRRADSPNNVRKVFFSKSHFLPRIFSGVGCYPQTAERYESAFPPEKTPFVLFPVFFLLIQISFLPSSVFSGCKNGPSQNDTDVSSFICRFSPDDRSVKRDQPETPQRNDPEA